MQKRALAMKHAIRPGGETVEEIEFRTHRKGFHPPIPWAKHMEKQASAIIQDDDPASEADEGI